MPSVAPVITALARQYGLDPSAVLAVARGEGGLVNRSGTSDIGDLAGGGSYGPFQLYAQGALPRRLVGNRGAADAWAWSPAGIRYALSKMASSGARGLKGRQAVETIIRRFERPADPGSSIAAALGRLGASPNAPAFAKSTPQAPGLPSQPGADKLAQIRAIFGQKDQSLLQTVMALQAAQGSQTPPGGPVSPPNGMPVPVRPGGGYNPVELFYDPLGGFKYGKQIGAIGGHSDHVHAAFQNAAQVRQAIALARRLGLRVSENPLVDHVDPVHVKNSYHYRRLAPGVGAAIDVSGAPAKMAALYRALSPRR